MNGMDGFQEEFCVRKYVLTEGETKVSRETKQNSRSERNVPSHSSFNNISVGILS